MWKRLYGRDPQVRDRVDLLFATLTTGASLVVIALLVAIGVQLLVEAVPALERFGLRFFVIEDWDPVFESFGAAAALFGTLVSTAIALLFALPVALGVAIFVAELAPRGVKQVVSVGIEMLAAIPSIVYGMWGLFVLAPILADHVEPALAHLLGPIPGLGRWFQGEPQGLDLFSAGFVLSIMIIPFAASVAREAIEMTPRVLKEAGYGLGMTRWEVVRDIVLPYARTGVLGGVALALGRALGETMAVAFVLGNTHQIPESLFDPATSITVALANEFTEADTDLYLAALYYLALVLFVVSLVIFGAARWLLGRIEGRAEAL